jgi:uncharacterized membrane protein
MTNNVHGWIGHVGFVVCLMFCLAILANQLWLTALMMILGFVLVYLEHRFVNSSEKLDPMHFE